MLLQQMAEQSRRRSGGPPPASATRGNVTDRNAAFPLAVACSRHHAASQPLRISTARALASRCRCSKRTREQQACRAVRPSDGQQQSIACSQHSRPSSPQRRTVLRGGSGGNLSVARWRRLGGVAGGMQHHRCRSPNQPLVLPGGGKQVRMNDLDAVTGARMKHT